MINDVEMLTYVLQNAEMGCQGITSVRKKLHDSKVDGVLCEQLIKYGKIYHCANSMLRSRGAEIHHVSPVTKTMTRIAAERDLKRDSSASHIAEMMIQGGDMGIIECQKLLNHNPYADQEVKDILNDFMNMQKNDIEQMKKFL